MAEPETSEVALLHASCVAVYGARRSLILDLQRQRALSIPSEFTAALRRLDRARGQPLEAIRADLDEGERARFDALVAWLLDQGLALRTRRPERFPAFNLDWRHPGLLYSAILDVREASRHDLGALAAALTGLGCAWLALRLEVDQPGERLSALLAALDGAFNLEIQVGRWPEPDLEALRALLRAHPRISRLTLFGAAEHRQVQAAASGFGALLLRADALDLGAARAPRREELSVTLEQVAISASYNLSLYKSAYIDAEGQIRNTVGEAPAFGQLPADRLEDVVRRPEFQAAWSWHKGRIAGCDRCELRRCCADPRWPSRDADGRLFHASPCAYDPEAGAWRDGG